MENVVAVDTETTGLTWTDTPFAVSLYQPHVVPWEKYYYDWREDETELTDAIKALQYYIDAEWDIVFHNAKFDLRMLEKIGITVPSERVHDTNCLAHLLDEHQDKRLKALARNHLKVETDEEEVLKKVRRQLKLKKEDGFYPIPREYIEPYAIKDAEFTYRLFKKFYPLFKANPDLHELYRFEIQFGFDLAEIEAQGIGVDVAYVDYMINDLTSTYMIEEDWLIDQLSSVGIPDPNPRSNDQIKHYLTTTGIEVENVQAETLAQVGTEVTDRIVGMRKVGKLLNTYFRNIKTEIVDGILHPWFRQHGTRTGRMSSGAASK